MSCCSVRTICDTRYSVKSLQLLDGSVWFCAKDVASVLGFTNTRRAVRDYVRDRHKKQLSELIPATGRDGAAQYLNEPALYCLIMKSKAPAAESFQDWVYEELLPEVRRSAAARPLSLTSERDLHYKIVDFARKHLPDALIAPGLGELQDTMPRRLDCWRKGYRAGQPDLLFLNWHKRFNGLAIELKSPRCTGVLSAKQSSYLDSLEASRWKVLVSNNYDHIVFELVTYFADIRLKCPRCSRRFCSAETLRSHNLYFHKDVAF